MKTRFKLLNCCIIILIKIISFQNFRNFIFLKSKFLASNKTCFSSSVKGEAITSALMVSSRLCFLMLSSLL